MRTERLLLREWRPADRGPFAEMNADPEVMRHFPRVLAPEESDAFVDRIERGFAEHGFGLWVVESEGRFAGYTGLARITFDSPLGPGVEIGWRLARWAWGKGLATEAARRVLNEAFATYGLAEVFSFTTATNARSEAVMQRIGMVRRADLDFDHPNTPGWWGRGHIVYRAAPDEPSAEADAGGARLPV